jgi:hypothetical protein
MRRWLLLPPVFAAGLFLSMHAWAGVKDTKVTANIQVTGGAYELAVANTGDQVIASFTFVPSSSLRVTSVVSSTKGSCSVSTGTIVCTVGLNPPPCDCTAGEDVHVVFNGSGEASGSTVRIGTASFPVNGSGSIGTTTITTTTPPPPPQPPPPPPPLANVQKLAAVVGPGAKITMRASAKSGGTKLTVRDLSAKDNFHLTGPGVNKKTGVAFKGSVTWSLMLKKGTYTYRSDAHAKLRGTLKVS